MEKFDPRPSSPADAMGERFKEHRSKGSSGVIVHSRPKILKVKCNGCGRSMEVKRESQENPPYYCFRCWDDFGK